MLSGVRGTIKVTMIMDLNHVSERDQDPTSGKTATVIMVVGRARRRALLLRSSLPQRTAPVSVIVGLDKATFCLS